MNVFEKYGQKLINLIGKYNSTLSMKTKYTLMFVFVVVLILSSVLIPVVVQDSFAIVVVLGTFLIICAMLLFISAEDFFRCKIKKAYLLLYTIIGGSFLANGIYFGVTGYIAIGIIFTVILPLFYKSLICRSDRGNVITSMCKGVIFAFFVFLLMSLLFGPPLDLEQYSSFLRNPNTLGAFAAIAVAAGLYMYELKTYNTGAIVKGMLYMVVVAAAFSMCFFSNSRTNMLCIAAQFLIYIIRNIISAVRKKTVKNFLKKAVVILLIFVAVFIIMFFLFSSNLAIAQITLHDSVDVGVDRFDKGLHGEGSDAFTSGRIGIWIDYAEEISFIGHPKESRDIVTGSRVYKDTNAHNAYLQVAYSAGIVAGISLLVLIFTMGVVLFKKALAFLFNKGVVLSGETMYMASAYLCFFISAITSGGYMLFTYLPATLFWLSAFLMMGDIEK